LQLPQIPYHVKYGKQAKAGVACFSAPNQTDTGRSMDDRITNEVHISEQAPAPHPPKKRLGPLAWMSVGFFICLTLALIALFILLSVQRKEKMGIYIPRETVIISIKDLHNAFNKDAAAAERVYKNMPLLITGTIKNINDSSDKKTTLIGLDTGGTVPAIARFDKQKDKINKLKEGQIIAFTGRFEKYGHVSIPEFLEYKSGESKVTSKITSTVLNWLPDVPFFEIVQLKKCELILTEQ
jgi:hypothetical protein